MKKSNIIIVFSFSIILFLPLFNMFFNIFPQKEFFEKRQAAQIPEIPKNLSEIKKYPQSFSNYFDDNYGFRKNLISANSKIMDKVFNQSPSERALIGKDDWLYFENNKSLLDAQGLAKISDEKITKVVNGFVKNWQKLKSKNINYVLVIAADKSTIYHEFLPNYIKYSSNNHRIDKFLTKLRKKSPNFPVIDLRKILLEAKKNEVIYHKTDTHWNRRGAFYGYEAIMQKFGLKYNSRNEFTDIINPTLYFGDISQIMGIKKGNLDLDLKPKFKRKWFEFKTSPQLKKEFYHPMFFVNYDKNLPILFSYKDSFSDNMLHFFAQNFAKSYFINEFPCEIDMKVIDKFQPNFVIQQFWEARIEEIANKCP